MKNYDTFVPRMTEFIQYFKLYKRGGPYMNAVSNATFIPYDVIIRKRITIAVTASIPFSNESSSF